MRERATRKPSASPYPRRHSISSEAAPGVPLSPGPTGQLLPSLHPGQGGEQQLSLPPGQGGEQQEAGLHIAEPNLQALQRQLQGISRLGPQISPQEESDNEEEDQFHSGGEHTDQECSEQEISDQETPDQENAEQENPTEDSQHADPMATALKNKLAPSLLTSPSRGTPPRPSSTGPRRMRAQSASQRFIWNSYSGCRRKPRR